MKIHQSVTFNKFYIIRVPGGWIYYPPNEDYISGVFVPYKQMEYFEDSEGGKSYLDVKGAKVINQ